MYFFLLMRSPRRTVDTMLSSHEKSPRDTGCPTDIFLNRLCEGKSFKVHMMKLETHQEKVYIN